MRVWVSVTMEMPPQGMPVNCQVQHCHSKEIIECELIHVVEDDCSWRIAADLSEVSYDWDVIAWQRPK